MRVFEWEDGFTPYRAELVGDVLTEISEDEDGEEVAVAYRLTRCPELDGCPADESEMFTPDYWGDGAEIGGEIVFVAWIDDLAYQGAEISGGVL